MCGLMLESMKKDGEEIPRMQAKPTAGGFAVHMRPEEMG